MNRMHRALASLCAGVALAIPAMLPAMLAGCAANQATVPAAQAASDPSPLAPEAPGPQPAARTTPTNARMLGALPADATSFLVADLPALLAEGSAYRGLDPAAPNGPDSNTFFHPLTEAALRYAALAGADAFAIAGSEFLLPPDLGVGSFNTRMIFHARNPITLPAQWLDHAGQTFDLTTESVLGIAVLASAPAPAEAPGFNYSPPPYAGERRYVALADDRTVVLAESAADVADMALAWREQRPFNLDRFGVTAEPALMESPLVILRDGLPASLYAGAPPGTDGVMMLVLTDVAQPLFTHRFSGPDAEQDFVGLFRSVADEASTDENGVVTLVWSLSKDDQDYLFRLLGTPAVLFGIFTAI